MFLRRKFFIQLEIVGQVQFNLPYKLRISWMIKVLISFLSFVLVSFNLKLASNQHARIGTVNWTMEQFAKFLNSTTSPKLEASPSTKPAPTSRPPQPTSPYSQDILDPYQKLYKWALANPSLNQSLDQDHQLNPQQQSKVIQYMVSDDYFQHQLISQLKQNADNRWLDELPPRAQIRYLKAIAVLNQEDIKDKEKIRKVEQRLLDDYDIGEIYEEYRGKNPNSTPIQSASKVLLSNYL